METNTATPRKADLDAKSLNDLKKTASDLKVPGAYKMKKTDLVAAVLKAQRKAVRSEQRGVSNTDQPATATSNAAPAKEEFKMSLKQTKIFNDEKMSKSDKFRALFAAGVPKAAIAKMFNTYYSFVLQAINRKTPEAVAA
jgi:hypothetical protein